MVLTCASSSLERRIEPARRSSSLAAAARARSSRSRSRSFSSPAAFSVNVTATICRPRRAPPRGCATIRPTSSVVFPVPAAASTTSVSSRARGDQRGARQRRRPRLWPGSERVMASSRSAVRSPSRSAGLRRTCSASSGSAHRAEVAPVAGALAGAGGGTRARWRGRRFRAPRARRGGWLRSAEPMLGEAAGGGAVEQPPAARPACRGPSRPPCRRSPAAAWRRRRSPSAASTGCGRSCDR